MLNEAQQRSLSVTFGIIEDRLREMEEAFKSPDYIGILRERINDVPPEALPDVYEKAGLIRERIKVLAEKLHLEKRHTATTSDTLARLAYCWEILEDARTKRLTRFGEPGAGLEEILDPQIDAVIDFLSEIERLLRSPRA